MALFRRRAAGFSLLEVLVSIIVLSSGLLGAVGMLTNALRSTSESGTFTTAVNLVRELSEKARINKNIAAKNDDKNAYLVNDWRASEGPLANTAIEECVGANTCDPRQLAAWDVQGWLQQVSRLPDARVVVCFDDITMKNEADDWMCDKSGRNLVVKLGWTARLLSDEEQKQDADKRPPRVVMQLIPGQDYDGYRPIGF